MWEPPAGLTAEDLAALPGAQYLSGAAPAAASAAPTQSSSGSNSNKVRASHLLIKHNGSRRPASWKSPQITRSKDEATEILKAHEKELKQAPELANAFAKLASTESDCSSARDGGDLGEAQRVLAFEPAADASLYPAPRQAGSARDRCRNRSRTLRSRSRLER